MNKTAEKILSVLITAGTIAAAIINVLRGN